MSPRAFADDGYASRTSRGETRSRSRRIVDGDSYSNGYRSDATRTRGRRVKYRLDNESNVPEVDNKSIAEQAEILRRFKSLMQNGDPRDTGCRKQL